MGRNKPSKSLKEIGRRLEKARAQRIREPSSGHARAGAVSIAFRLSVELVSGLVVGGGIGWLLDRWWNIGPWLLIVFFFLGAAAGVLNAYRAAMEIAAHAERQAENQSDGNGNGA